MDYDKPELAWHDELELPVKKLVIVRRPDDVVMGDELQHTITKIGVSKILLDDDSFYSIDLGNSYLNMTTPELEAFYMIIGKALRYT